MALDLSPQQLEALLNIYSIKLLQRNLWPVECYWEDCGCCVGYWRNSQYFKQVIKHAVLYAKKNMYIGIYHSDCVMTELSFLYSSGSTAVLAMFNQCRRFLMKWMSGVNWHFLMGQRGVGRGVRFCCCWEHILTQEHDEDMWCCWVPDMWLGTLEWHDTFLLVRHFWVVPIGNRYF